MEGTIGEADTAAAAKAALTMAPAMPAGAACTAFASIAAVRTLSLNRYRHIHATIPSRSFHYYYGRNPQNRTENHSESSKAIHDLEMVVRYKEAVQEQVRLIVLAAGGLKP